MGATLYDAPKGLARAISGFLAPNSEQVGFSVSLLSINFVFDLQHEYESVWTILPHSDFEGPYFFLQNRGIIRVQPPACNVFGCNRLMTFVTDICHWLMTFQSFLNIEKVRSALAIPVMYFAFRFYLYFVAAFYLSWTSFHVLPYQRRIRVYSLLNVENELSASENPGIHSF